MIDVAVHLGDVRRVDEEDVPGSERLEALERYLLEAGRHNLDPLLVAGLEEREKEGRVRFDEGARDAVAKEELVRIKDHA